MEQNGGWACLFLPAQSNQSHTQKFPLFAHTTLRNESDDKTRPRQISFLLIFFLAWCALDTAFEEKDCWAELEEENKQPRADGGS